jgi:transcriptional regulator GlxA family with amidase domain
LLGLEVAAKLSFDSSGEHNPAMQRLQRLVFQFASDFDGQADLFSSLAASEIARGLIMNFLICNNHRFSYLLFRNPPTSHLSTTKMVEEFIEANWDKPIDIEQMSAVAGVSARTLFRQFKKDRGYSPAEFVRRIRLDRARNMLERAVEGASVTQVALRCGFQNTGHFAREFRLTFGELPSETLRRTLRAG